MDKFKNKVKSTVKNNFKISVDKYFAFENKYNFFEKLTVALTKLTNIKPAMKIIDIGCGYGVSTKAVKENYNIDIIGVDISEDMINFGKKIFQNMDLIVLDGENLLSKFQKNSFDIAFYNASVFIFPDPVSSFKDVYSLLKETGEIAFSHYPEIKDVDGNDLFEPAFKKADFEINKKRTVSDLDKCVSSLEKAKFKNIIVSEYSVPLDIEFLIDFFQIPAQSASLFPKLKYTERAEKVKKLFSSIKNYENKGYISWKLVKADKG